ncbi:MAG: hypothetical protein ACRDMH_00310 [Solirubrobacterales bacterium]
MAPPIRIPWRSRDEPLDGQAIEELPRALPDSERPVARQLLVEARGAGAETVGDALDLFGRATAAERRAYAEAARLATGAPTLDEEDKRLASIRASRFPSPPPAPLRRDANGEAIQTCHADGCEVVSTTKEGALQPVAAKRWWCAIHVGEAAAGDMEPYEEVIRVDRFGFPVMREEVQEHYARQYADAEEQLRGDAEARDDEQERLANLEADYRSGLRPPAGFGPRVREEETDDL